MSVETDSFEIFQIEWCYQKSRGITSSRNPSKPVLVGVAAMSVRCKECGTEWRAVHGRNLGQLREILGAVHITCPECATKSTVSKELLNQL